MNKTGPPMSATLSLTGTVIFKDLDNDLLAGADISATDLDRGRATTGRLGTTLLGT